MYHSGIGGGGFMLVKSPDGSFEYIDFRETAPAAAYETMFNNLSDASTLGGLARYENSDAPIDCSDNLQRRPW
jgi:gamma-glutamyltranspeptidase/glutathione hydrolase